MASRIQKRQSMPTGSAPVPLHRQTVFGVKRPAPHIDVVRNRPRLRFRPRKARANRGGSVTNDNCNREADECAEELALSQMTAAFSAACCIANVQIANPQRRSNNGHCLSKKQHLQSRDKAL